MEALTDCKRTVSETLSLPSRGTFHLSLTVLVHYRSHRHIQAYPTVRADSHEIPRVSCYSGPALSRHCATSYGAITLYGKAFNPLHLTQCFITTRPRVGTVTNHPTTPSTQPPTSITRTRFSHHPLSLATTHGISFPAGTKMFHFPAYPPHKSGSSPSRLLGSPIRTPSDQSPVGSSPRLIAAPHVLHRSYMPRHPPYALTQATTTVTHKQIQRHQTTSSHK